MTQVEFNLSRLTDPKSSVEAGEELQRSGIHERLLGRVLFFLSRNPDVTAKELGVIMGDTDTPHKRLPTLRKLGAVMNGPMRQCRISNRLAQTWFVL